VHVAAERLNAGEEHITFTIVDPEHFVAVVAPAERERELARLRDQPLQRPEIGDERRRDLGSFL
jgi:hypothetical protein